MKAPRTRGETLPKLGVDAGPEKAWSLADEGIARLAGRGRTEGYRGREKGDSWAVGEEPLEGGEWFVATPPQSTHKVTWTMPCCTPSLAVPVCGESSFSQLSLVNASIAGPRSMSDSFFPRITRLSASCRRSSTFLHLRMLISRQLAG